MLNFAGDTNADVKCEQALKLFRSVSGERPDIDLFLVLDLFEMFTEMFRYGKE